MNSSHKLNKEDAIDLDSVIENMYSLKHVTQHERKKKVIELEPGTVLEKEYKGNKIKVKVLKNGNYSFNGKEYESRGDLMKAVAKGKTAQFTTFFGIAKGEKKAKKNGVEAPVVEDSSPSDNSSIEGMIRGIVRDEIQNLFRK